VALGVQAVHQLGAQCQQLNAQILSVVAVFFAVSAAQALGAFELGFEFEVEFAAFGHKLASDKVTFFGFT
jgi:hypothetical protein